MKWRQLPPVHSPVPAGAVLAGALGGLGARRKLEEELAHELAADRVVLTDRGTSALQVAIGLAAQPVVALPAFGCYDLATAAVGADVRVALYDVDPATLGPDLDSLARVLAAGAGTAVIAVPFGFAPDWAAIERVADAASVRLIEDAAQGHGGALGGAPLGSLGRLSVLSFGRGKGWTGGGGGALLLRGETAEPELPRFARPGSLLRTAMVSAALCTATRPSLYRIPASLPGLGLGETRYRPPSRPGAMPAPVAAVLRASRGAARREAERRRRNGVAWREQLHSVPDVEFVDPVADAVAGYLRFPCRVAEDLRDIVLARGRDLGIVATYPTTLAELPAIRERRVDDEALPGAEALVRELVTLPTHGAIRPLDVDRTAKLFMQSRWTPFTRRPRVHRSAT